MTGMIPGSTGVRQPSSVELVHHPEVVVGIEEELRHTEVGRLELLRKHSTIGHAVAGPGMQLGVRSDTDAEARGMRPDGLDQLEGVLVLASGIAAVRRRIAAKGQDVLHARVRILVEQPSDVVSRAPRT